IHLGAQASTVLTSLVTDEEGRLPLAKAVVFIPSLNLSTLTDSKGHYTLSISLKAGESRGVQVQVSAAGFAPKYMPTILVEGKTTTLNFALTLSYQTQITVEPPEAHPPPEISQVPDQIDRKSTRLNSSHVSISY